MAVRIPTNAMIPKAMISRVNIALVRFDRTDCRANFIFSIPIKFSWSFVRILNYYDIMGSGVIFRNYVAFIGLNYG